MFEKDKKIYLLTYYNYYYEAKFIRSETMFYGYGSSARNTNIYTFRTRDGDIHLYLKEMFAKRTNFITTDFSEVKLEMAKRIYRGDGGIKRTPLPINKILLWGMNKHPEKLI